MEYMSWFTLLIICSTINVFSEAAFVRERLPAKRQWDSTCSYWRWSKCKGKRALMMEIPSSLKALANEIELPNGDPSLRALLRLTNARIDKSTLANKDLVTGRDISIAEARDETREVAREEARKEARRQARQEAREEARRMNLAQYLMSQIQRRSSKDKSFRWMQIPPFREEDELIDARADQYEEGKPHFRSQQRVQKLVPYSKLMQMMRKIHQKQRVNTRSLP